MKARNVYCPRNAATATDPKRKCPSPFLHSRLPPHLPKPASRTLVQTFTPAQLGVLAIELDETRRFREMMKVWKKTHKTSTPRRKVKIEVSCDRWNHAVGKSGVRGWANGEKSPLRQGWKMDSRQKSKCEKNCSQKEVKSIRYSGALGSRVDFIGWAWSVAGRSVMSSRPARSL